MEWHPPNFDPDDAPIVLILEEVERLGNGRQVLENLRSGRDPPAQTYMPWPPTKVETDHACLMTFCAGQARRGALGESSSSLVSGEGRIGDTLTV